jgi:hypothetical protein
MTTACETQAVFNSEHTNRMITYASTWDLLFTSYHRNHLGSMSQTLAVAKLMMNANTHCLQHIHINPKPKVNLHIHTNPKPNLCLDTVKEQRNCSLYTQIHIYNIAWESHSSVSRNPDAMVNTVTSFCDIHAGLWHRHTKSPTPS